MALDGKGQARDEVYDGDKPEVMSEDSDVE